MKKVKRMTIDTNDIAAEVAEKALSIVRQVKEEYTSTENIN